VRKARTRTSVSILLASISVKQDAGLQFTPRTSMKSLMSILIQTIAAAFSAVAPAGDNSVMITRAVTMDVLDIAPVWAAHPVGFALFTQAPLQFVAFYDHQRRLTVAQRRLEERQWSFHPLPVTTGWDSHNYIALAVDDGGYLHLSGDMHVVPLKYFRSAKPLDAATFERVEQMVGREEQRTTYPRFFRGPANEFLFTYRDGSSGNGNQLFNVYNSKTKTWKRLLNQPLTDGQGERNAYFDGPVKGPDGYFHLAWVWRETPDAASNHDLSYARSGDLIHWESGDGKALALPITLKSSSIVDPVPEKGGMINSNIRIGFDDRGRATISYHKHDAAGNTQPWTARLESGKWQRYQITDWPYRWDFGGGGALPMGIRLGPVRRGKDGRLSQTFSHVRFGSGSWLIDPQSLRALGTMQSDYTPPELDQVEGTFPGLKVNWADDSGYSGTPDSRYTLRWETLDANRDKPREGKLPPPSKLRLYLIKNVTAAKP
jgi:hypothetical protein